ncbi:MspA family porin [Mycolicibacterium sarraceniae]|uniref:MspA protein n=1 Tax=Mycolicibacterium sarraceniae TaxID=1534348 RepID=A0A7I7SVN6_9MYCO|nr:MspA family porin [Mycolicibacterium sarraceniae]BBY59906.1 hypothetical protein MSAR_30420 [Mycolicibacterium sarraceniae]
MSHRIITLLSACVITAISTAPLSLADPPADSGVVSAANPAPAPAPAGAAPIASGTAGTLTTPDGWVLTVGAKNESLEPVAPLTNSPWSREYLVDGSFQGAVTGSGTSKLAGGSLEVGYQIGCGIIQDDIESISTATGIAGINLPFTSGSILPFILGAQAGEQIKIDLKPGTVNIVPVDKKSFKGTKSRVTVNGFRIKIDGCAGQSFIRSYATFTSSTDNTDDVVTYLGVTRAI